MKKLILAVLLSLIIITGCSKSGDYQLTSNQVMEKFDENESFVLYFTSETCPACQIFSPVYKEVSDKYPNVLYTIDFQKEKARDSQALTKLLADYTGTVNVTPTVLIIVDGKVQQTYLGIMKFSELENAVTNFNLDK